MDHEVEGVSHIGRPTWREVVEREWWMMLWTIEIGGN